MATNKPAGSVKRSAAGQEQSRRNLTSQHSETDTNNAAPTGPKALHSRAATIGGPGSGAAQRRPKITGSGSGDSIVNIPAPPAKPITRRRIRQDTMTESAATQPARPGASGATPSSSARQQAAGGSAPAVATGVISTKGTSTKSVPAHRQQQQQQQHRHSHLDTADAQPPFTAAAAPPPTATTTATSATHSTLHQNLKREESQEAAYLNQSARESINGSTTNDSRYNSNRRLTDDMLDNGDEFAELGGDGAGNPHSYLSPPAGLTKNLIWAVVASAVGSSFQHGYNGGVVNAPEKLIGEFINQTYKSRHGEWATETQVDFLFAVIVSIFCIGGCIGALLTALVADKIGRKEGLMYNNLIVLAAAPMMASARSLSSYELLIFGRLLIGVNAGLNAGLAPLYLNEIAPVRFRGAFGTIYQLVITISILLSNIFGLPSLLGDHDSWPILFAIPIIPAAFMLAALPHCYESPKHLLLNQGKELQAQQALAWFRQTADVQDEMEELRYERESNSITNRTITLRSMIEQPSLRRPLTIAIVIMLSQQFSGINAVLFYSTSIFRDAGLSVQAAVKATLGMSSVNVTMTLVSLFLVDRAGRRTLHMTGLMGMAATCLVLAICVGSTPTDSAVSSSISIVAIYLFIAMFAIGPGAIPWFLVAELFPSNARPIASSIAVAVNWLANFTVSLCFLPLSNILHGYTFILFAILLVIFYLFTYYKVPETKGATAEEISALFMR